MEQLGINLKSVILNGETIVINYDNDTVETLNNNLDTYKVMHTTWLVPLPIFITDKFKIQMKNIILASTNTNQKAIDDLKKYFSSPNELEVVKFLTYMRKRAIVIPPQKEQWTVA